MKNVFEKYEEIPFVDFSAVTKKKEDRDEIASTVTDIRTTMNSADSLRSKYETEVNEEKYGMAEETRNSYNSLVKSVTILQEKLKTAVEKYEENYNESVYFPTARNENSVEYIPNDRKIIVT
jgi:hypothetical protein